MSHHRPAPFTVPGREDAAHLSRLICASRDGPHEATGQTLTEAYAYAVWSRLLEPGDGAAGTMIEALGAAQLLAEVVAGSTAKRILTLASESDHPQQPQGACSRTSAPVSHDEEAPSVLDETGGGSTARGTSGIAQGVLEAALARWRPRLVAAEVSRDLERGAGAGMRLLLPGHALWPEAVNDLGAHRPQTLWCRGNPELLRVPGLAVVGSRAASGYGEHVTVELAGGAVQHGWSVVSGAAYGIDGMAHRTALAGGGTTVAVLAGGADRNYPRGHDRLIERISQVGVVCSELPPGQAPTRWRFLQRNRVIAALSRATLVCEAGRRSGSLNTAGHAATLGRALGAVPGPITSAGSAGCHRLLREYDAQIITGVSDMLELLGATPGVPPPDPVGESAEVRRVLDALPLRGALSTEALAAAAGLSEAQTRSVCAELLLLGRLVRRGDGWGR